MAGFAVGSLVTGLISIFLLAQAAGVVRLREVVQFRHFVLRTCPQASGNRSSESPTVRAGVDETLSLGGREAVET
jgi:hypothetical protein